MEDIAAAVDTAVAVDTVAAVDTTAAVDTAAVVVAAMAVVAAAVDTAAAAISHLLLYINMKLCIFFVSELQHHCFKLLSSAEPFLFAFFFLTTSHKETNLTLYDARVSIFVEYFYQCKYVTCVHLSSFSYPPKCGETLRENEEETRNSILQL